MLKSQSVVACARRTMFERRGQESRWREFLGVDTNAFDNLVRDVSRATSRRATIAAAGAALIGAALAYDVTGAKNKKKNRKKKNAVGDQLVNLCCKYTCEPVGPGPSPVRHYCIEGAIEGTTRCDQGFEGCSFDAATFVDSCSVCG